MPKKDQWRPWMAMVNASGRVAYEKQLDEAMKLLRGCPEHVTEVAAAALTTARLMVEEDLGCSMQRLAFCKLFICEKCLLGGSFFECSVGAYKKRKVEKSLHAYAALYENYLQGE